jgi:hypothetical protein
MASLPSVARIRGRGLLLPGIALALVLSACAGMPRRWSHPVTVSEVVFLSQAGVSPDDIIAKMKRGGTVYVLGDADAKALRKKGVTPMVLGYMQQTYVSAARKYPKIEKDETLSCFYMGPDGYWYGGGPWGFHPDC